MIPVGDGLTGFLHTYGAGVPRAYSIVNDPRGGLRGDSDLWPELGLTFSWASGAGLGVDRRENRQLFFHDSFSLRYRGFC